jgi:hypothetical protein
MVAALAHIPFSIILTSNTLTYSIIPVVIVHGNEVNKEWFDLNDVCICVLVCSCVLFGAQSTGVMTWNGWHIVDAQLEEFSLNCKKSFGESFVSAPSFRAMYTKVACISTTFCVRTRIPVNRSEIRYSALRGCVNTQGTAGSNLTHLPRGIWYISPGRQVIQPITYYYYVDDCNKLLSTTNQYKIYYCRY